MKRLLAFLLALAMIFSLAACGKTDTPATDHPSSPISVMVLNGTTGFGMANLMDAAANGTSGQSYQFSVEGDASNITAALINGSADIAALPTNAAAAVYNKTQGGVQVLALNTLGVLYLLTDGSVTVDSLADLEGRTVYVPAQNPTFIFQHILHSAGVANVTIDNTYAQPADLNAAVAAGEVSLAVLPEPMVTIAKSKNPNLQLALDLTAEWDKVSPPGSLVQGCVVVRTAFADKAPAAVAAFLEEYGASIRLMQDDMAGTAAKIEANGIFTNAAVAEKAIPRCNPCFITGQDMKSALADFLTILYDVAPASVGGAVPADDFYCILEQ